jgi:hypothetical protein
VGPEVKHGPEVGTAEQGARGALGRCRMFQVAEKRHGRFGVVVGEGVVEPRIEGRLGFVCPWHPRGPAYPRTRGVPGLLGKSRVHVFAKICAANRANSESISLS